MFCFLIMFDLSKFGATEIFEGKKESEIKLWSFLLYLAQSFTPSHHLITVPIDQAHLKIQNFKKKRSYKASQKANSSF